MITIKVIASSSLGNCYLISDGVTQLLLECGIPIKKIKEALNFKLSNVSGCLASHEHKDHVRSAKDLIKLGIDVYTSRGTAEAIGIQDEFNCVTMAPFEQVNIGTWTVKPFPVMHDAAEPFGFLLASGKEKLLFATDTASIDYDFKGISILMLEANYDRDILGENAASGSVNRKLRDRIRFSHFSIHDVLELIERMDTSKLQAIYLMHLSDSNSNENSFKMAVAKATGVPVYVCGK